MLLKPLSHNVFYASLMVLSALLVSVALAEPVFGGLMDTPAVDQALRQVVVPLFLPGAGG